MQPEQPAATAATPCYQGRTAVAALLGATPNLLAHWLRRHPSGVPEPDAYVEEPDGNLVPLWHPGRDTEWQAWRASFPGRTGRPRKSEASED